MSDGVSIVTAFVTLFLVVAAFVAVLQVQRSRKVDAQRMKLKDIIDFATEMNSYTDIDIIEEGTRHPEDIINDLWRLHTRFGLILGRNSYINFLSIDLSNNLRNEVLNLSRCIWAHRELTREIIDEYSAKIDEYREDGIINRIKLANDLQNPAKKEEFVRVVAKLDETRKSLLQSATTVIMEAVKIYGLLK